VARWKLPGAGDVNYPTGIRGNGDRDGRRRLARVATARQKPLHADGQSLTSDPMNLLIIGGGVFGPGPLQAALERGDAVTASTAGSRATGGRPA
jgi:hypothetical protein